MSGNGTHGQATRNAQADMVAWDLTEFDPAVNLEQFPSPREATPETVADLPVEDRLAAANIAGRFRRWTFETFPRHAGAQKALKVAKEYAANATPQPPGLLLVGPIGTGKTSLTVSIARARIEAGDGGYWRWSLAVSSVGRAARGEGRKRPGPVWCESWAVLKGRFKRETGEGMNEGELLEEIAGVNLLVLDEIGLSGLTDWREEVMWEILSRVERGRRLVLTSNLGPAELIPMIGERNADRLTDRETFRVVALSGQSLRSRAVKA
jgi:DNA replication protein DnaC